MEWKQIRKEREVQGEAIKFATSHLKSILYSEEQYMNFYSYSLTPLILLNDIYNKVYAPSFKPSRLHMSTSLTDGL